MKEIGVGIDFEKASGEFEFYLDRWFSWRVELRLMQRDNPLQKVVHLYALELRLWHFGEVAEASDDGFEV
jgi:hypothetical protein